MRERIAYLLFLLCSLSLTHSTESRLGAAQDYGTEFTLEFSPEDWKDLGCPTTFHRDVLIMKDEHQLWVDANCIPTLHYPFGKVNFSLDEVAGLAFSTAGDHTKMQVVTRNGQNYIGTIESNTLDLYLGCCHEDCTYCQNQYYSLEGVVNVNTVDMLMLKQRSCIGLLLHEKFYSIVLVNGDRFPVIIEDSTIQLSDGSRSFSIKVDDIADVQFRGGLYGFLRGEALSRQLQYSYVKDKHLSVKLAKDNSPMHIPWDQIDRIRKDSGDFILTTPYRFNKWIPDGMVYVPGGRFSVGEEKVITRGDEPEILRSGIGKHLKESLVKGASRVPTASSPSYVAHQPGFFIDKYEVTNAEYAIFCQETGHPPPAHWHQSRIPLKMEKHPVVNVSLHDAQAYAKWAGKRLPSEVEWERAAKGANQRRYPYGDRYVPGLSHLEVAGTAAVGSYETVMSRYQARSQENHTVQNIQDMSGNVAEWTMSPYHMARGATQAADWSSLPIANGSRGGYRKGVAYVVRGGAFDSSPATATTTHRTPMHAEDHNVRTGFRCVVDAWQGYTENN